MNAIRKLLMGCALLGALGAAATAQAAAGALPGGLGQCGENGGEDGVGPARQLVVPQQLDWMRDVGHPAGRHAQPASLLDGFVGERRRRDTYRGDPPALKMDEVAHTARRA